ncbi:MAG TPA: hypothetical protein VFH94_16170 [Streptomyces sp.]|nr:hypothetical protein [Streptomyces sp.]
MHGSGVAPPARNDGAVIGLRVLFTLCGALSCGLVACMPLFRIALLRGKGLDWVLAWGSLPVTAAAFAVVGSVPEEDPRTDVAVGALLLLGMASAMHFLIFDIRFHKQPQALGGPGQYGPYANTVPQYGYPHHAPNPAPHHAPNPAPHPTPDQGRPPNPYASVPAPQQPSYGYPATPPPHPPHPPQHPQPQRLDQVRAELDELSDYLRRDSGGSGGNSSGSGRDGDGR